MMYRPEGVGSAYGWAPSDARAVQIDDVTKTPGIMFVAAMSTTEVLPITMAVPQPVTVTGEMFEWWVEHFLIPDMIAKGKRVLVLDNARPHRKNVLRALLAAARLEVWFLPKYSPWFMPMEKVFLITHMRCSAPHFVRCTMHGDHVLRKLLIMALVWIIQQNESEIEARQ